MPAVFLLVAPYALQAVATESGYPNHPVDYPGHPADQILDQVKRKTQVCFGSPIPLGTRGSA